MWALRRTFAGLLGPSGSSPRFLFNHALAFSIQVSLPSFTPSASPASRANWTSPAYLRCSWLFRVRRTDRPADSLPDPPKDRPVDRTEAHRTSRGPCEACKEPLGRALRRPQKVSQEAPQWPLRQKCPLLEGAGKPPEKPKKRPRRTRDAVAGSPRGPRGAFAGSPREWEKGGGHQSLAKLFGATYIAIYEPKTDIISGGGGC